MERPLPGFPSDPSAIDRTLAPHRLKLMEGGIDRISFPECGKRFEKCSILVKVRKTIISIITCKDGLKKIHQYRLHRI